jgi:hypothetical protein
MLCNSLASARVSAAHTGGGLQVGSGPAVVTNGCEALAFASYVGNDPVNLTDPSGLSEECIKFVAGGSTRVGTDENGEPITTIEVILRTVCWNSDGGGFYTPSPFRVGPIDWSDGIDCPGSILCAVPLPPPPPPCDGPVRAVGLTASGIAGIGAQGTVGRVTVMASGESSWFVSVGGGSGLDVGLSGGAQYFDSLSDFAGYGETYSVSYSRGGRTVGGSVTYNARGRLVGRSASASGLTALPGVRYGGSGTVTHTYLLSGSCRKPV